MTNEQKLKKLNTSFIKVLRSLSVIEFEELIRLYLRKVGGHSLEEKTVIWTNHGYWFLDLPTKLLRTKKQKLIADWNFKTAGALRRYNFKGFFSRINNPEEYI